MAQLLGRLDDLVTNFRKITSINRNVGFFTTGYNWMIQIIPALIIAPAFIERKIEFGVITQSAVAFSTLVAAFSLIVTQFQSLSSYAAVVARLSALVEAVEQSGDARTSNRSSGPISRRAEGSGMSARDNRDQSLVGGERHAEWPTRSYSSTASPIVAKKDPSPI